MRLAGSPAASSNAPPEPLLSNYPTDEAEPPPDRMEVFQVTLFVLTPRIYVTKLLIAANVLIFVFMMFAGVSFTKPTIADLLRWGANFGPKTIGGEWWRLFTCMFIHIGFIHILCNMWVLSDAGPLVERMLGNAGFLILYVVSGLIGTLVSIMWNPMVVSAGASGAIFGVCGALLGVLVRQHRSIPPPALVGLRKSGLVFLGLNLVIGMMVANIDFAAHVGGLVGGFLCGVVLSQPFRLESGSRRPARNFLTGLLGIGVIGIGILAVQNRYEDVAKLQDELDRFVVMEKKVLDVYNAAVAKADQFELTDEAFADILEREVLPEWRATRERLQALKNLPAARQQRLAKILEYMGYRQEAWELMVQALREGSVIKAHQSKEKQRLAEAVIQHLNDK